MNFLHTFAYGYVCELYVYMYVYIYRYIIYAPMHIHLLSDVESSLHIVVTLKKNLVFSVLHISSTLYIAFKSVLLWQK